MSAGGREAAAAALTYTQAEIDAQANVIPIDTTTPAALPAAPQPVTIPQASPATGEVQEPVRRTTAQPAQADNPDF